jgi:glycolate oxidase iron-sulfur subunit
MQTHFTPAQLQDPHLADANGILRACVHCGFCTATCPTYVLGGDERDSPRGRIYMIKQMLEDGGKPAADTVTHIDRCLSCLACMTTCPSGVNYMHLIDQARAHVENTHARPLADRALRALLTFTMPRTELFRYAAVTSALFKPFIGMLKSFGAHRIAALVALSPKSLPRETIGKPGTYPAPQKKSRVALLRGCVQPALDPDINAATIRLLNRLGHEVVVTSGESCCGSISHHAGKENAALGHAKRMVDQWSDANVDHIIITASGCGTTIKDYGHMLRLDSDYAEKARIVSAKARDVTEFLSDQDLQSVLNENLRIAYHSACSLQHGQKVTALPITLLKRVGFDVVSVPEGHLCCGSAGTYNILQPEIATQLRDRKLSHIAKLNVQAIAAGNIGCITQLAAASATPLVHTVELLDWATGGPKPTKLKSIEKKNGAHSQTRSQGRSTAS